MSRTDESREFMAVRIAVLTVSDTRTPEDDKSGDALAERLTDVAMCWRRGGSCRTTGR